MIEFINNKKIQNNKWLYFTFDHIKYPNFKTIIMQIFIRVNSLQWGYYNLDIDELVMQDPHHHQL